MRRTVTDDGLLSLQRNVGGGVTIILLDPSEPGQEPSPIRTVLRRGVIDVLAYIPLSFDAEGPAMTGWVEGE